MLMLGSPNDHLSAIMYQIVLNPGATELQMYLFIMLQYNYLFFHQIIHMENLKPVTILSI